MVIKKRSSTGCLICRRRKKKCDEVKPTCTACKRNFLECIWPNSSNTKDGKVGKKISQVESEDTKFNITHLKLKHRIKYTRTSDLRMEVYVKRRSDELYLYDGKKLQKITKFPRELPPLPKDSTSRYIKYHEKNLLKDECWNSIAPLDLELKEFPFVDIPDGLTIPPYELETPTEEEEKRYIDILQRYHRNEILDDTFFQGVDLESFIFYTCLTGFIPKLGTQYTSPELTVGATFVPFVSFNPIMRQVFLCCGATFLAWKDFDRFQRFSDDYFVSSVNLLRDYMSANPQYYNEDWIFGSTQLLCIRVKNAFFGTVDDSVKFLSDSYKVISHRYFDNRVINPHERMFVESFIYHYSISVLCAKDISKLPSPFVIFKELNKALSCPVYNCENVLEWMKNPVLGSCLDMFEIIAKLSYIARLSMPLTTTWLLKVVQLRNICIKYKHPMPEQPMKEIEWFNFRINSMVGLLTAKSCYLFASKMIDFDNFDAHSSPVKECVKEIIQHFKEIPEGHQIWGILSWTMLVSGSFCTDPEDQDYILQLINKMAETAHSYAGVKMTRFLHDVWNHSDTVTGANGTDISTHKNNINHLFDRERLSQVDM